MSGKCPSLIPKPGMILLDHKHWLKLNRMAADIHAVGSRDELVGLVSRSLPFTLNAEEAFWNEHGPIGAMDRVRSTHSREDAILSQVLASIAAGNSHHPAAGFRNNGDPDADHGIYDVADLISRSHRIATQFFVEGQRGILITVQNSRPFTAEQRLTLSLLREHLAIAARRHYRRDSGPADIDPTLTRREREVFPYLAKGFTNPEIAGSLGISPRTVEKHVASILDKAGFDNRRMLIGLNPSFTREKPANKTGKPTH